MNAIWIELCESKTPMLVDFWAEWCGPCRTLAPIVEAIAEQYGEAARVFKLNVHDSPVDAVWSAKGKMDVVVSNAALFLASDESSFMTGSDMVVDGAISNV